MPSSSSIDAGAHYSELAQSIAVDGLVDALPARVRDMAALRGLGYSFSEIGRLFGVTPQAISLMLTRYRRSLESIGGAVELRELSARAVNALGRHGIRTREEAQACNLQELLRDERNCGRKTLDEIMRWLQSPATSNAALDGSDRAA